MQKWQINLELKIEIQQSLVPVWIHFPFNFVHSFSKCGLISLIVTPTILDY